MKGGFNITDDMEAHNRVHAVERGVGRVQNFVADLASTFIAPYRTWIEGFLV